MTRPRLLDLFCGAGGCSVGYHRAGFDVTGLDIETQRHYPFAFVRADALRPPFDLRDFDVIHASPPCQAYSRTRSIHRRPRPDLLGATRGLLLESGRPWVLENVTGAPMTFAVLLCGLMFDLKIIRHRFFESSHLLFAPEHPRHGGGHGRTQKRGAYDRGDRGLITVAGNNFCPAVAREAMGIDWMSGRELSQSIPPAYTEFIGRQLMSVLENA